MNTLAAKILEFFFSLKIWAEEASSFSAYGEVYSLAASFSSGEDASSSSGVCSKNSCR